MMASTVLFYYHDYVKEESGQRILLLVISTRLCPVGQFSFVSQDASCDWMAAEHLPGVGLALEP